MEVSSLWKNLTLTFLKPVQQRTGFRRQSSRTADRGFHISGLRQFEIGDSFRSISRKHYARTGEEVVIERHPLQNALILLLIDFSGSMTIGSERRKIDAGLELLLHFGKACLWQGNKVQVAAFSNTVEYDSGVVSTSGAFENIVEELAGLVPESQQTDPVEMLDRAMIISEKLNAPADMVCIVSDFIFPASRDYFYRDIDQLKEKTDVIGLLVMDPVELKEPGNKNCLKVRDAETGEFLWYSGISQHDILQEFDKHDFEACMLSTDQNNQQWYAVLDDFFLLRKEAIKK